MRRHFLLFWLALLSLSVGAGLNASSRAQPSGLPVGKCINIGNTLDVGIGSFAKATPVSRSDFERIHEAGFDTVRIPVRWDDKSDSSPPHTVSERWMEQVAEVVDWAIQSDLNVILDSHRFAALHRNPTNAAHWHGAVWKQIGERFSRYPDARLWFELENEPSGRLSNHNLLKALAPALSAVRLTNPTRPVIYGGDRGSGVWSLDTLDLPDDPHVYPTFHYYEPFGFTHQGAHWLGPRTPPPGRRFGGAADRELIQRHVRAIEKYIDRTGRVPFIGEVGVYDEHVSPSQRASYHRVVFDAFTPLNVGICNWSYANTFPFYDRTRGKWVEGMRAAVGLAE